jgi:transcriptional regulator with XRE-family HTH domain
LSALLRSMRVEAGMTIEQVAERLLCSPSKVSRMETGQRSTTMRDIRDLCDLYRVDDAQRDYLADLARESRQRGWWQSYDVPHSAFIGLEADASSIATFECALVPGILQTADYARAVIAGTLADLSPEALEQRVAVRLKRQLLLTEDNPPQLNVIIDEAGLRRIIGNPPVMKAQLDHVIEISDSSDIAVQIIPYTAGAYAALDSSFTIFELPAPVPAVIYVEELFGSFYIDRLQDVERYRRVFRDLQSTASTEQESIALIKSISRELNSSI